MSIKRKVISDYYEPEIPRDTDSKICVERSGFIPRSVLLAKMAVQGELNKVISQYENDKLFGRSYDDSDLDVAISPLNIKDLNRTDLVKGIRARSMQISELYQELSELEKAKVNLMRSVDDVKLSASAPAAENSAES